jgi:hypothetical protein
VPWEEGEAVDVLQRGTGGESREGVRLGRQDFYVSVHENISFLSKGIKKKQTEKTYFGEHFAILNRVFGGRILLSLILGK